MDRPSSGFQSELTDQLQHESRLSVLCMTGQFGFDSPFVTGAVMTPGFRQSVPRLTIVRRGGHRKGCVKNVSKQAEITSYEALKAQLERFRQYFNLKHSKNELTSST